MVNLNSDLPVATEPAKGMSVFQHLLHLSRDSVIYGFATALSQLLGFLLIPVYTRYLSPSDYGALEILRVTLSVLGIICVMGLGTALFRSYFKSDDDLARRSTVSTALLFLSTTTALITLMLVILAPQISSLFFGSAEYAAHFRIIFLTLFCDTGIVVALAVLRARGQPVRYALASVARFGVAFALTIVFLAVLDRGVLGVLEAGLIATAVVYLGLIPRLVRQCGVSISANQLKEMLSFGLPLIGSGLGALALVMADRYFLQFLSTTQEVGLYSLGYRFGMVIHVVLGTPFQTAWMPFIFALGRDAKARETYSRVLTYFLMVTLLAAVAISALSREILAVMATPEFYAAHRVVLLIALSYVLYGCYLVLAVGINLEGKTKYLALLVGGVAILNLGLNYVLIPPYGMMGAAVATLVCYALLPVGSYLISQHYCRVDYQWGRVGKLVVVATLIYGGAILAERIYSVMESFVLVGALKLMVLAMYPVLLYLVRFYEPQEIEKAKQLIRHLPAYVRSRLRR